MGHVLPPREEDEPHQDLAGQEPVRESDRSEFLDFLKLVARAYPRRQLQVVLDNYATHQHARVQAWLAGHPLVHLHFTRTYGSWLNLVEVFFAIIERQALRRGNFASVEELIAAIRRFCDGWNQRCHPFTWTKDADQILTKLSGQTLQRTTTGREGAASQPNTFGLTRYDKI